ncbi:putative oxidoreductase [Dioscorea sansibarensis]
MASLALSPANKAPVSSPVRRETLTTHRGGFAKASLPWWRKHRSPESQRVNFATETLVSAPPAAIEEVDHSGKLAAWTSIRRERWEGELVVVGNIPLWL